MEPISNYIHKYYYQDGINDQGWGCGWRCIQMLLSQLGINKDIFSIAQDVKEMVGDNVNIDLVNKKINMADAYWIMLYVTNVYHQTGFVEADFEMFTIESMSMMDTLREKIELHLLVNQTLITVTAGGATSLISGVKDNDNGTFDIYLVDPHIQYEGEEYGDIKGFGKGGHGWINIRDVILKGKDEIGILDDDEFLVNSSCLFGFIKP